MEQHCLIIVGGEWNKTFASRYIKEKYGNNRPYVIAADRGLIGAEQLGFQPDILLGDFDSIEQSKLEQYWQKAGIEILSYPAEKDDTDSALALMTALERGATHICILAGTGTRLDHTFANVGLLLQCLNAGIQAEMVDSCNRIRMIDKELTIRKEEQFGTYVSLLPFTEQVTGITLKGFRYPLQDATLELGMNRGVSNEIEEEVGEIQIRTGKLLVMETKD